MIIDPPTHPHTHAHTHTHTTDAGGHENAVSEHRVPRAPGRTAAVRARAAAQPPAELDGYNQPQRAVQTAQGLWGW